jgi:AbrB family looped-hinge helix DNA binding protein
MTRKGQLTIPKHVRDELGLKPYDKIEIYLEKGEAKLRWAFHALREIADGVPPCGVPYGEMRQVVQDEQARRYVEELE